MGPGTRRDLAALLYVLWPTLFYLISFFFWKPAFINAQSRESNSTLAQNNVLLSIDVPLAHKIIWQPGKNRLFAMGSVD